MKRSAKRLSALGIGLVLTLMAVDTAEARRGGSFGSRGMRTYSAPRPTPTAPRATAPVQRSMTPPPKAASPAPAASAPVAAQPARRGFLGGMGGALIGGLVAGGLLGAMLGHGFGGFGAGMANTLVQVAIVGVLGYLVMAFLRRRKQAGATAGPERGAMFGQPDVSPFPAAPSNPLTSMFGGGPGASTAVPLSASPAAAPAAAFEIGLLQADRDAFERLLAQVQAAFGAEDYAALRQITTPEVMSYLSEELSQNAVQGRRNEVSQTRLLQADVAEAWNEGEADYATTAMRYESIDVMRDRQSGAVIEGDPGVPTQTTELWTFVRTAGQPWKLSAIQEA